jgi:hypoxanthine-guanine phosphoribosyltransferase
MIDDLCDSGLTLMSVRDKLLEAGAASVKSVVLLDKRARRKVRVDSRSRSVGSRRGVSSRVVWGSGWQP